MVAVLEGRIREAGSRPLEIEYAETTDTRKFLDEINEALKKYPSIDDFIPPSFNLNEKNKIVLQAGQKPFMGGLKPLMLYPNFMDHDFYTTLRTNEIS